jgi:hypothetical protein
MDSTDVCGSELFKSASKLTNHFGFVKDFDLAMGSSISIPVTLHL